MNFPLTDPVSLVCFAIGVLLAGALAAFAARERPRARGLAFVGSLWGGCAAGLIAAAVPAAHPRGILAVDALSALFLAVICIVCLCAGLFGERYIGRSESLARVRDLQSWYLILVAALIALVVARHAVVFLIGWEVMALASFFMIVAEDDHAQVRRAGLLYFVSTHTATLALFILFALLARHAGSLDFEAIRDSMRAPFPFQSAVLALAMVGFGTKAGVAPFHIWLQEAHPAAPSHVSAVMSGVVIKIGVYGFFRLIWLLREPPAYWASWLIAAGAVSGVGGVLFALAQHDLKRLLAYHSVENIGIIVLGLGLGCLGISRGLPETAVLGFAGAALHTLNHGLFKSLLFLGSGAYHQALGTRDVESGGGLLKTMPWTSALSLVGAAAISGIPPLNGFVSEWLVFLAGISAAADGAWLGGLAVGALALIGGFALACFAKAYGAMCLGNPRSARAASAVDAPAAMLWPMGALAAFCAAIGLFPAPAVAFAGRAAAFVAQTNASSGLGAAVEGARLVGMVGLGVLGAAATLWLLRSRLVRVAGSGPTWGCGFAAAIPRAQYTASSFAHPLTRLFAAVLDSDEDRECTEGLWPREWSFSSHTPDRVLDRALMPGAGIAERGLALAKRRLRSRLQYYLLTAWLFLLLLLIWRL